MQNGKGGASSGDRMPAHRAEVLFHDSKCRVRAPRERMRLGAAEQSQLASRCLE
jgi:hypothetical protein